MHIEYFKYFYEVCSSKSISKVATNSHISQSALSQQIQRMEDSLGIKLLERSNKGVELTEAGHIVEKYSRSLYKTYDNMINDLDNINENTNTIKIDSHSTIATYALPCTLFKIKKEFPKHNYLLTSNLFEDVEQNLINDGCDVGIICDVPRDPDISYAKVGSDRIVVVASPGFDIKKDVSVKDLLDFPLIMLQDKCGIRRTINSYFNSMGNKFDNSNILFNLDSVETVKSSVIEGYGISFLPYLSIKKELYTKQLIEVKVDNFEMNYDIYLIYKHDKFMNPAVLEFIQYLKKTGEKSFC